MRYSEIRWATAASNQLGSGTLATIAALLAAYLVKPSIFVRLSGFLRENAVLIILLLLMSATKLFATIINSGAGLGLFYVVDDLMLLTVPAIGVLLVLRSSRDETNVVLALALALVVTAVLAGIESVKGSVLLEGVVDVSVAEAGKGGLTANVRSDAYRAKALFDNPLLMAEFACIIWPWAVYLWFTGRSALQRWCGLIATVAAPATLYLAHTRSGWLIFSIGAAVFLAVRLWDKSSRVARVPLAAIFTAVVAVAAGLALQLALNSVEYLASGVEGSRSVAERLNQYVVVAIAWVDSPVFGYGMTRNFTTDLDFLNNFDNYWLRLLLEGGSVLFVLFLVFVVSVLAATLTQRRRAPTREYRLFMTAAATSIVSFCLYKLFLSMPTNNGYFLIVAVLVLRRKYWVRAVYTNAHPALSQ